MRLNPDGLLDHLPYLVKTYGKWPSFLYLIVATIVIPQSALLMLLAALLHLAC